MRRAGIIVVLMVSCALLGCSRTDSISGSGSSPGLGTGSGTSGLHSDTPENRTGVSVGQKISGTEAVQQAKDWAQKLGINPGALERDELVEDPVYAWEYWDIQFVNASAEIDPSSGGLRGFSAKPVSSLVSTGERVKSRKEAEKLAHLWYAKLGAPPSYQLTAIKTTWGNDQWLTTWQKEVLPGIFSKYESVNLYFSAGDGSLLNYRLFDLSPKSVARKVSEEQAVTAARPLAHAHGFSTLTGAKLGIEQANGVWLSPNNGAIGYVTLAWTVSFKDPHGTIATIFVDAANGSLLGGDQTL
ncbi:hypothetical protein CEB3_c27250 [Peptococcaceae bacterium CEB3]|nr:hypothetical protein CEB3_c27250 [Peptococcaceae bacterium CEB3]